MWNPLFRDLLTSSLLAHGVDVLGVWTLLLASTDRYGDSDLTVPFLAERLKIPEERVDAALLVLSSPDPRSRSKDRDGRRIIPAKRGWHLVTHHDHRVMASKAAAVERMREYRLKLKLDGQSNASESTARLRKRLKQEPASKPDVTLIPIDET